MVTASASLLSSDGCMKGCWAGAGECTKEALMASWKRV